MRRRGGREKRHIVHESPRSRLQGAGKWRNHHQVEREATRLRPRCLRLPATLLCQPRVSDGLILQESDAEAPGRHVVSSLSVAEEMNYFLVRGERFLQLLNLDVARKMRGAEGSLRQLRGTKCSDLGEVFADVTADRVLDWFRRHHLRI